MSAPAALEAPVFARWCATTGLHPAASADSVYRAWVERCGYDTIRKLLAADNPALMPGCDPSSTVTWVLDTGAGATCMAGAVALCALLRAHGHEATLVGCQLNAAAGALPPGAPQLDPGNPIGHLGVLVTDADGCDWWFDTAVNHQRGLLVADGVTDSVDAGFGACTDSVGFHRTSATTGAPLHFEFDAAVTDHAVLGALIEHTRHTVDREWPLYLVRDTVGSRWAARAGRHGCEQMDINADRAWHPSTLSAVFDRAGIDAALADQVAVALETFA